MAHLWTVDHLQHELVPDAPNSSTLTADGSVIQTVKPENLHFLMQLGVLGPGTISYEISRTAKNDDGSPVVVDQTDGSDMVAAYKTDFALRRADLEDPVMAGMHTSAPSAEDSGDAPLGPVQIAGMDWLHYLDLRVWPYDATLSYVNWPDGFAFNVAAAEIGQLIKDILETVRDLSAAYPGPPDPTATPSYSLGFTVDADDTGVSMDYLISPFDSTTILAMIQQLASAETYAGGYGFEFFMTWDKVFRLVYPSIGDPTSPVFTLEVDATTHVANMRKVGFTNNGPLATHVLGVGSGTANKQGGINKHFPKNSAVYRRIDQVASFAQVADLGALEALTGGTLAFGANPVHEIPVEVDPADIPNFWTVCKPGVYVEVVYDLGVHQINSVQKVVSMDCTVDEEGNETVVLGFNQYYDVSPASGIDDW